MSIFLKRNVFNDFLKVTNVSADRMSSGSGFHRAGAARLAHVSIFSRICLDCAYDYDYDYDYEMLLLRHKEIQYDMS